MKYSKELLISKIDSLKSSDFILFWGHQPKSDGSIGKSCFSQWFISPFVVDGIEYRTAEHWMMAAKARLFKDEEILQKILENPFPNAAKSFGRKIKNFDEKIWDNHKMELIVQGNYHKFSQNKELKEFLLSTGNQIIVEASPQDKIWGIGIAKENPNALNPLKWEGENLLGFAIMEVRDQLRRNVN
jgi:ribA/ribD-fused uncharacterized protein